MSVCLQNSTLEHQKPHRGIDDCPHYLRNAFFLRLIVVIKIKGSTYKVSKELFYLRLLTNSKIFAPFNILLHPYFSHYFVHCTSRWFQLKRESQ